MKRLLLSLGMVGVVFGVQSCKSDDDNPSSAETQVQQVKENYADIVLAGYEDSYAKAIELKEAIDAFVANPTAAGMETAKEAWYESREPYGQTEAFRFADGPIDAGADAVEGMLNAWPLDESFVDYVNFNEESQVNLINNVSSFPTLSKELLRDMNEYGGEERSVTLGYHAIEFLLWGQDSQVPTPGAEHTTGGNRPYTDFVDGGTASHQDRRRQYLRLATDILLEDLEYLISEWDTNGNNYRSSFLASDDDTALRQMLTGIGVLAGAELAEERILVAVEFVSQEDEHSCFSDNTHRDIFLNYLGIKNVYTGSYTRVDGSVVSGPSIHDLLLEQDQEKAQEIMAKFAEVQAGIQSATIPFDYSLTQASDVAIWNNVVAGLRGLGENFAQTASILGVGTFPVEVPE